MGGDVAGVYEDIATRDLAWIERVRVCNTDNADGLVVSRLPVRTQVGEEMIAQTSDEVQGLCEEGVEEVRAVEGRCRCKQVGYGEHCGVDGMLSLFQGPVADIVVAAGRRWMLSSW